MRLACLFAACLFAAPVAALPPPCNGGFIFHDADGDGRRNGEEALLEGIAVSDGLRIVRTNALGEFFLPVESGRTTFVIKPAGWQLARREDGLPDFWRHVQREPGPVLKHGGIADEFPGCRNFALSRDLREPGQLRTLLFADPQPRSIAEVGYYERGIVEAVMAAHASQSAAAQVEPVYFPRNAGDLGLTLGDVVDDDLSLYPRMNRATARLGLPWLHLAGNHDIDFDATRDEDSLRSFRNTYGPDTFAWEEHEASFVLLDNVIYRPGQKPAYIGGLREDQFAFLAAYLPTLPRERRLVVAAHIPFFEPTPGRDTFRDGDRQRLFALLAAFPHVLLLTAHGHVQRHHFHDAANGWQGQAPLHEYNLGAASGAYWSGAKDAAGIPAGMMADGTPRGWAELSVLSDGRYYLSWRVAGEAGNQNIGLHVPKVLRRGAYPAFGAYANVYLGLPDALVEMRVGQGGWQPMQRVDRADPRLAAENARDDDATALRGFDRAPEAAPSTHLWRGTLPTDLPVGEHRVEVRTQGPWQGPVTVSATYRLVDAAE